MYLIFECLRAGVCEFSLLTKELKEVLEPFVRMEGAAVEAN
jgi:hypothetical protein